MATHALSRLTINVIFPVLLLDNYVYYSNNAQLEIDEFTLNKDNTIGLLTLNFIEHRDFFGRLHNVHATINKKIVRFRLVTAVIDEALLVTFPAGREK